MTLYQVAVERLRNPTPHVVEAPGCLRCFQQSHSIMDLHSYLRYHARIVKELGGIPMQVVQAIGAAETKLLDFGAPSRIDGEAAIKLVNVSKDLGIKQYVMVTSLGTTKLGFPAGRCLLCRKLHCHGCFSETPPY